MSFHFPTSGKKQLLVQVFDLVTKSLNEPVGFYDQLETAEETLHEKGDGTNPNKKFNQSGANHQSSSLDKLKGSNQTKKTSVEDAKIKTNNNKSPTCTLHAPGNNINLCKVLQEKAKSAKSTCSSASRGGGCSNFTGAKK